MNSVVRSPILRLIIIIVVISLFMLLFGDSKDSKKNQGDNKKIDKKTTQSTKAAINKFDIPVYPFNGPDPFPGPVEWDKIPEKTKNEYLLDGKVTLDHWYLVGNDNTGNRGVVWSKEELEKKIKIAKERKTNDLAGYGPSAVIDLYAAFDAHPIKGKSVLVVGTIDPWIECIAYAYGASEITTVDFNKPISELPQFKTYDVQEFGQLDKKFDVIVSFSSIEHDGLGRYGDPINPFGDIERVKVLKKYIKKDGLFYLGVPIGKDKLYWNAHRIYGRVRYPMLTRGWKILGMYKSYEDWVFDQDNSGATQPVIVLKPEK